MNSKSLLVEKNGNKGIRDSGDSLVTKFYHSTQEGSIKNSELSNNSERKGRTSITKKFEDLYQSREDEKYQIRYSSIMEEKGEDGPLSMQNYSKSDIDSKNNRESEIEKDLANLLDSEQVSPRRPSVRR